jgi:rod shape-determining protein MreD
MTERIEVAAPDRFFWSDVVKIPIGILLAIFVQVNWDNIFSATGWRLDFVALFIVFLALWRDDSVAACSGFVAGIALSLLAPEPLGIESAALVLLAYVMGYVRRKISLENTAILFVAVFAVLVFQSIVLNVFSVVLGLRAVGYNFFGCFLTALALIALSPMLRKVFPRTQRVDLHVDETAAET